MLKYFKQNYIFKIFLQRSNCNRISKGCDAFILILKYFYRIFQTTIFAAYIVFMVFCSMLIFPFQSSVGKFTIELLDMSELCKTRFTKFCSFLDPFWTRSCIIHSFLLHQVIPRHFVHVHIDTPFNMRANHCTLVQLKTEIFGEQMENMHEFPFQIVFQFSVVHPEYKFKGNQ